MFRSHCIKKNLLSTGGTQESTQMIGMVITSGGMFLYIWVIHKREPKYSFAWFFTLCHPICPCFCAIFRWSLRNPLYSVFNTPCHWQMQSINLGVNASFYSAILFFHFPVSLPSPRILNEDLDTEERAFLAAATAAILAFLKKFGIFIAARAINCNHCLLVPSFLQSPCRAIVKLNRGFSC